MKNNFRNFILWGGLLFPSLLVVNTVMFKLVLTAKESFFLGLGASIAVSWLLMLTLYYVWAIYFYNINRGWTDKDWAERDSNLLTIGSAPEPEANPNSEQTLGLPPGTVRGTIALTVLVIGLAAMVASFGFPSRLAQNEFLIDHIEFLKTAFLMVIAFYFGGKSLEFISQNKVLGKDTSSPTSLSPSKLPPIIPPAGGGPPPPPPPPDTNQVIGDIATGAKSETDFNDPSAKG